MPRPWPLTLLLPVLAGGCVTTTERDCGLYDFDCQDSPRGEALFEAQPAPGEAETTTAAGTGADAIPTRVPAADSPARLEQLERRVERLERRLDALE